MSYAETGKTRKDLVLPRSRSWVGSRLRLGSGMALPCGERESLHSYQAGRKFRPSKVTGCVQELGLGKPRSCWVRRSPMSVSMMFWADHKIKKRIPAIEVGSIIAIQTQEKPTKESGAVHVRRKHSHLPHCSSATGRDDTIPQS